MGKRVNSDDTPRSENTRVLFCGGLSCTSAFQDAEYGRNQRVHNRTKQSKPTAEQRWRCTVCRDEKPV